MMGQSDFPPFRGYRPFVVTLANGFLKGAAQQG